jgi:hypothetical protein
MTLETSRLRITGVTGGPLRITGASLVNGAYELATAGGADYELQTERQTTMDNILFIPGLRPSLESVVASLFSNEERGAFWSASIGSMTDNETPGSGSVLDASDTGSFVGTVYDTKRGLQFVGPPERNLLANGNLINETSWNLNFGGGVTWAGPFAGTLTGGIFRTVTKSGGGGAGPFSTVNGGSATGFNVTQTVSLRKGSGANSRDFIQVAWRNGGVTTSHFANFNLVTGTVERVAGTGTTATIEPDGDFFRCRITSPKTAASTEVGPAIGFIDTATADRLPSYTTAGVEDFDMGAVQVEIGEGSAYEDRAFLSAYPGTANSVRGFVASRETPGLTPIYRTQGGVNYLERDVSRGNFVAGFVTALGDCTVVTNNENGLTINENVTLGSSVEILRSDSMNATLVIDRTLTPYEKSELARVFKRRPVFLSVFGSATGQYTHPVTSGTKVYAPPFNGTAVTAGVLVIDSADDTASFIGAGTLVAGPRTQHWLDGRLAPNGMIYMFPIEADSFLKIDPSDNSISYVATPDSNNFGWYKGAIVGNVIYVAPRRTQTNNKVLKLDTATDTATELTSPIVGCASFTLGSDGKLYSAPREIDKILVLDPSDDSMTTLDVPSSIWAGTSGNRWTGSTLIGTKLYYWPRDAADILVLDIPTGEMYTIPTGASSGGGKWDAAEVSPAGMLYFFPRGATSVMRLDPATEVVRFIPIQQNGFIGRARIGDAMYLAPFSTARVGRVNLEVLDNV